MKKLFFVFAMAIAAGTVYGQQTQFVLFPANSADLKAVSAEQAIINNQTFISIAQSLLNNPQQRLLIDGHANPVLMTALEETESLKPLSERRAEAAANYLVDYFNVPRSRLIITGAGGGFPSAANDPAQNRRVSFYFIPTM